MKQHHTHNKMVPMQFYTYPFAAYFSYPQVEPNNPSLILPSAPEDYISNFKLETYRIQNDQKTIINFQRERTAQASYRIDSSGEENKTHQIFGEYRRSHVDQKMINLKQEQKSVKNETQKDGRNANSNLLKMFFRRLDLKLQGQSFLIRRIIEKNKLKTSVIKFIEWYEINRVESKTYIRLPVVKNLFMKKKLNNDHTRIMRILLKDYLQKDALCSYLTSKRIKKSVMCFNFQSIRMILREIYQSPNDK